MHTTKGITIHNKKNTYLVHPMKRKVIVVQYGAVQWMI
jgi:hypothetical protein